MNYSEWLSLVLAEAEKDLEVENTFYLCKCARSLPGRETFAEAHEKHLKRFLTHIRKLLNIQHKQRRAYLGDYIEFTSVLSYMFHRDHNTKLQYFKKHLARIQKQEI